MMTCGRARRLLWPDTGPREVTSEIVAAREHASRCPPCQRFLDDMRRLGERIREAAPRPEAPVEVRDRLFKAIARARTNAPTRGTARPARRWAAGLTAALLVAGTWLGLSRVPEPTTLSTDALGAIADDHLGSQRSNGLSSSDSLEVARWLADRLPFAVQIPIFPAAQLEGARLLLVNRQSGAVVDYMIAGRPMSYTSFRPGTALVPGRLGTFTWHRAPDTTSRPGRMRASPTPSWLDCRGRSLSSWRTIASSK